jgi:hypothetical protein
MREEETDYWRVSDKMTAMLYSKFTRFEMQPYAAIEGCYDLVDNSDFFGNTKQYQERVQLYAGCVMKAAEQFNVDICLIEQETKENDSTNTQTVLQFKIKYLF